MVSIRPGRYTNMPKGYLTYPYANDANSMGLSNVLLTEKTKRRYIVETGNTKIDEMKMSKTLSNELQKIGCRVYIDHKLSTVGRKTLTENKIPVEIRKIIQKGKLIAIRIRMTGKTEGDLLKNVNTIKDYLSRWQIKPTECVWSQGNWQEELKEDAKPIVSPEEILKEQARLKNILADMQDKIQALEKPSLIKSMNSERKARAEVLR